SKPPTASNTTLGTTIQIDRRFFLTSAGRGTFAGLFGLLKICLVVASFKYQSSVNADTTRPVSRAFLTAALSCSSGTHASPSATTATSQLPAICAAVLIASERLNGPTTW